jgi:signal transduction histidine kinase
VPRAQLAWACWFWLAGAAASAVLAWLGGAELRLVAGAAALAMAPSLTGFILLPRLGERWADAGLTAVWLVTAAGLAAGTGGAGSPLAAAFAVAPAMTIALGRPWAPEAGAAAVLGYATAAALAQLDPDGAAAAGGLPELLSVASLALAAGLMAIGQGGGSRRALDEAMSRRVAEVSHELRTPLTHILGFSEMIERQIFGEIGSRYVEYASLIRKSGTHLLGLVNDLLDISRIEAGRYDLQIEEFDVRGVVEEVVRLSVDAADRKSISLGMVTPETPLMARADARALRRMLINTVGNAIKFTPENGRVMVTAAVADGVLTLETIDTGPGIPEADKSKLGQAYERGAGAARAEGAGLGLSLVRALAGLHGGALSFHDAPGGGALVRITLPVSGPSGS